MAYSNVEKAVKTVQGQGNLTTQLTYQGLEDGVVFTRDNKLSFGLMLSMLSPVRLTPGVRVAIRDRIISAIQGTLPLGAVVRHYTDSQPSTKNALAQFAPTQRDGSPLEMLLQSNHDVLERIRVGGFISTSTSYLTVTLPLKGRRKNSAFRNGEQLPFLKSAAELRSALGRLLTFMGMVAMPMTQDQVWARIINYMNPDLVASEPPPYISSFSDQDLKGVAVLRSLRKKGKQALPFVPSMRAQVTCSSVDLDFDNCFMLGMNRVAVVSFMQPSKGTFPNSTEVLLRELAGTHSTLIVEYQVVDTPKVRAEINDALDRQTTAANDASMKAGREIFNRLAEGNALISQLELGQVYTHMSMHVVLFARRQDDLDARRGRVLAAFSSVGGAMPRVATQGEAIHLFLQNAPFMGRGNEYQVPSYYQNAADCIPKVAPWKGSQKGVLTFRGRSGNVFAINPLDMKNAGVVVCASSGSGKSVLINTLDLNLVHKYDAALTVIDPKRDHVPSFMALGAMDSVLKIGPNSTLPDGRQAVINPFDLSEDLHQPDTEKTEFILDLMTAMKVHHPEDATSRSVFMQAITDFYYRFSKPLLIGGEEVMVYQNTGTLSDFADVIERLSTVYNLSVMDTPGLKQKVASIANGLRSFTGNTAIGRLLDGQTNVNIKGKYLCLDIKDMIEGNVILQNIGMLLVQELAWNRNMSLTGTKVMVIEEGGVTQEVPAMVKLVNRFFKTGRSLGMVPILAVQNVSDARAYRGVINNASTQILLAANPEERQAVAEIFGLNEAMFELYSSLTTERGRYSEALVLQEGQGGALDGDVGQLWLSREFYWLTTSVEHEARQRAEVALTQFGGDQAKAALSIAKEHYEAA